MGKYYFEIGDTEYIASNDNTTVIGTGAANEKVMLGAGVQGVVADSTIERVDFAGNIADFQFQQGFGSNITVLDEDGNELVFLGSVNGKQFAFADGTVGLGYNDGTVSVGETDITDITDGSDIVVGDNPVDPGDEEEIDVDIDTATFPTQTDFDADGDAYNFIDDAAISNYAVIDNFTDDDTISFVNADVNDYAFSNEGEDVTLSYNYNDDGTMNVIELIGVVSSDVLVYDLASFTDAVGFDAFG